MPKVKKVRKPRVVRSKRLRFNNPFASSGFDYPYLPDLYNALPTGVSSVEAYEDELDAARRVERENAKIVIGKDAVRKDLLKKQQHKKIMDTLRKTGFPTGYTASQLKKTFKLSESEYAEILQRSKDLDTDGKFKVESEIGSGLITDIMDRIRQRRLEREERERERRREERERRDKIVSNLKSGATVLAKAWLEKDKEKNGGSNAMKKKRLRDIVMQYQDIPSEYAEGEMGRRFNLNQRDFNLINSLSKPVGGRALIGWQAAQPYSLIRPLVLSSVGWVPPSKEQNDAQRKSLNSRQKQFSDDFLTLHGVIPDSETVKDAIPDMVEPFNL